MKKIDISEYKKLILNGPQKRIELINYILEYGTYEEIFMYYDATPVSLKGIYKYCLKYIICNSYDKLFRKTNVVLRKPIDFVGLVTFIIYLFKDEINEYILLKNEFEKAYLLGEYVKCNKLLNDINEISYSVWSAINKIKLAELEGGLNNRIDVYNSITDKENIHSLLKYILNQAQETSSIEASQHHFICQRIDEIKKTYKVKWQIDYLIGMMFPSCPIQADEWLSYNLKASIIDIYETFTTNLHLIINSCRNNDSLKFYISKILESINDERVSKLYGLLLGIYSINNERNKLLITELLDGGYEEYCMSKPYDIDVLVHYISICAILGKEIGNDKGCLIEKIKYHLYKYFRCDNSIFHYNKIEMICLSNHTMISLRHLYNIIRDIEERNLQTFSQRYWHYSLGYNIQDANFYTTEDDKLQYLAKSLEYNKPNLDFKEALPMSTFKFLSVMPSLINEDISYDLEYMSSCKRLPLYTIDVIVSHILAKYLTKKDFKKAVYLYIDAFFNNKDIKIYIDKKYVETYMTRIVDIEMKSPLELSIFYFLIKAQPSKIAMSAYRYLELQNITRPSHYEGQMDERILFFMENVVDEKIMSLFPLVFNDIIETMQERIDLCRRLKQWSSDSKRFANEMSRLTREIAVIQNLKHVNESKIDVDITLLKKTELSKAKEFFDIYKETDPDVFYLFEPNSIKSIFPKNINDIKEEYTEKSEARYIPYRQYLFTQYYLCIRDVFLLNNKAGLDYFLSSRIRHGTIVNQLRKDFQERKLTTRKNAEGGYETNTFWAKDILKLQGPNLLKAYDLFRIFTEKIDTQISILKNLKIQVKTESHNIEKPACFDFSHSKLQDTIYTLYKKNINQYEYSIDEVLESLWEYTENCFPDVKKQITYVKNQMELAIDTLKSGIIDLVDDSNEGFIQFSDALTTCHTQLENNIDIVANWFRRSQSLGMDFTILELIDTAIKGINKNSDVQLNVEKQISSNTKIKGRYLGVLYTLMHNIYGNVVEYFEKFAPNSADCKTVVKEKDDIITLRVTNRIRVEDINMIKNSINQYKILITKENIQYKVRNEKKSGFFKMDSIVRNHLGSEDNTISFSLSEFEFIVNVIINIKNIKNNEVFIN